MYKANLQDALRKHFQRDLTLVETRKLRGATEHDVKLLITDGKPEKIVAKIAPDSRADKLEKEYQRLQFYTKKKCLRVPETYAFEPSFRNTGKAIIFMEYFSGETLTHADINAEGRQHIQKQLAEALITLHSVKRDTYGDALIPTGQSKYLDWLQPELEKAYEDIEKLLESNHQRIFKALMKSLESWMPEFGEPTLIHGDIWDAHLIIDAPEPNKPKILGLVDVQARFSDVEEELAHMLTFNTIDNTFLDIYCEAYPLREGFDRRRLVYQLLIWMRHAVSHGTSYLRATCHTLDLIQAKM